MEQTEFIWIMVLMGIAAFGIISNILFLFKTNAFTEIWAWIFGKTTVEVYDGAGKKKLTNIKTMLPGLLDHRKQGPVYLTKGSHFYDVGTGKIRYQLFAEHFATVPPWINAVVDKLQRKYGRKVHPRKVVEIISNDPDYMIKVGQNVSFKLNDLKEYFYGTMSGAAIKRAIHHKVQQQKSMEKKSPIMWVSIGVMLFLASLGVVIFQSVGSDDPTIVCQFPNAPGPAGTVETVASVQTEQPMVGEGVKTAYEILTPDKSDSGSLG